MHSRASVAESVSDLPCQNDVFSANIRRSDGYPIQDATEIAVEAIRSVLETPEYDEVRTMRWPEVVDS